MLGLFVLLNLGRRSVPPGHRATPVEAIDQFASHAVLAELFGHGEAGPKGESGSKVAHRCPVKFRKTILGLPEQTGEEAQSILVAGADEPATLRSARQDNR